MELTTGLNIQKSNNRGEIMEYILIWIGCGLLGNILQIKILKSYGGDVEISVGLILILIGFAFCGPFILLIMGFIYISEEYGDRIKRLLTKPVFVLKSKEDK